MLLSGLSLVLNYGISRFRAGTWSNRLHQQGAWLSFMLFLGIIGGLLSCRLGFVIGPMAVVLAYGLIRFPFGQSYSAFKS